jgi:hypothetical protein
VSRFTLLRPMYAIPTNGQPQRLSPGTNIADSSGNALAGDVVCPSLANSPNTNMSPLDAAGVAAMAAAGIVAVIGQRLCAATGEI